MWAEMFHLLIGNALIGIGEAWLLAKLLSLPKRKCVPVMILANYASAWFGALLLGGVIVNRLPMDLTNGWMWFWIMVVVTYCMTVVLEWPFIAWRLRDTAGWLRRSLWASFVVNSASYIILFGWYWIASGTSLYTNMNIVEPVALMLPESVIVYYIAPTDGNVYRRKLSGGSDEKIFDLHSIEKNDRLITRRSTSDSSRWDLVARLESNDHRNPRFVDVQTNLQVEAPLTGRAHETEPPRYEGTWFNFGPAQTIGGTSSSKWKFWSGFWSIGGLSASNEATGERVHFSYETPFGAWTVRNAVHVPGDKVIFQLGQDQICAFDPVTRRVALLWHGKGAVPIIEVTK